MHWARWQGLSFWHRDWSIATPSTAKLVQRREENLSLLGRQCLLCTPSLRLPGVGANSMLLAPLPSCPKCLQWHMICVRWYCQCPSPLADTHARGCDWLIGFDRAENWSSGRSKAQSCEPVKWQYWVIASVLYQIKPLVQRPRSSVVHTIKAHHQNLCINYNWVKKPGRTWCLRQS